MAVDSLSSSGQKLEFMNLLVAQLQNQNPLEPMNNQDMAAQLAQFSQLEESEKMNTNLQSLNTTFDKVLQNSQLEYAQSLLEKQVYFEYDGDLYEGQIKSVDITSGGIMVGVEVETVGDDGTVGTEVVGISLDNIRSIK